MYEKPLKILPISMIFAKSSEKNEPQNHKKPLFFNVLCQKVAKMFQKPSFFNDFHRNPPKIHQNTPKYTTPKWTENHVFFGPQIGVKSMKNEGKSWKY